MQDERGSDCSMRDVQPECAISLVPKRALLRTMTASMKLALVSLLLATASAHSATIWIEGEAPTKTDVIKQSWYDGVKKENLSGGNWLSHYGNRAGEAAYDVKVTESGTYAIWARLNPVASKPTWSLDGAPATAVDFKDARGQQNLAPDGKPDHRFIAWVKLATAPLKAGSHTVMFHWEGGAQNSGALDCFLFTNDGFVPQGAMKPGEAKPAGGPGDWFPLLADEDPLSPKSVIDMSSLVPAPAGQFGFLKSVGKDLRFEKSAGPVKLWGVGANLEFGKYSQAQMTQRAKYLRKFGINIVRQHAVWDELAKEGHLDPKRLDAYDWWFAELKKNGIHTDWSVFYHWTIRRDANYPLFDDLEGKGDVRDTYGVITAAPKLWELRNRVVAELLTHKNPYTGLRYADDPALAIVEMQNEDSIFFWNPLGGLADPNPKKWPAHAAQLRQGFAAWVKAKYKTDDALKAGWGQLRAGDSVKAAELRLMSPWELEGNGPRGPFAGETRRAGDYIQYLAELQRGEFESAEKTMRETGYKGVTMTTAWQVGGPASDAANIWTDTVGSMIDRHNYAGGGEGGHGIKEGKVNNESHLGMPGGGIFTMGMKQVESRPFCVTEWTQSPPNQWKLETAPIMAFYGLGLQGWDASFHFIQSGTRLGDGWPNMSSYASDTPAYMGQFPALALALYRGDLKEAPVIAARRLSMADVFSGTNALKQDATKGGYDIKSLIVQGGTPLEAFAIGRVTVDFAGGKTEQADFGQYWNQAAKTITSATGELTWDYGHEVITLRAPKTQAVIGKAGGQKFELPGLAASFRTPFVSTIFSSLDGLPLVQSKHILITALAQDRQTGTRYNADGTRLEATGTAPLLLEPVQATLLFKGAKPLSVTPCDHYGVPMADKKVAIAADGSLAIDGSHRAYYYEVKR
jgi:hypothetical protein